MSAGYTNGISETIAVDLTSTSETDIVPQVKNVPHQIKYVNVCNYTGSTAHITLTLYKGATGLNYVFQENVNGKARLTFELEIDLKVGDKFTATAQTANALAVHCRVEQLTNIRGDLPSNNGR